MENWSVLQFSEQVSTKLEFLKEGFVDGSMSFPLRIITPGRSLNDTIYTPESLDEMRQQLMAPGSHSKKMYIDHIYPKKGEAYVGRSVRDWAAVINEAFIHTDSSLIGKGRVTKHCSWIYDTMKDMPEDLGVSIHISALVEKVDKWVDGKPGTIIRQVIRLFSTDFVTEASAGGGIFMESISQTEEECLLKEAHRIAMGRGNKEVVHTIESILNRRPIIPVNVPVLEGSMKFKTRKTEQSWSWKWESDGKAILDKGGWALIAQSHAFVDLDYTCEAYEGRYPKTEAAYAFPICKLEGEGLSLFQEGLVFAQSSLQSTAESMSKKGIRRAKRKVESLLKLFTEEQESVTLLPEYWINSDGEKEDEIIPFRQKISSAKKMESAHQIFWALSDYLRILMFDKSGVALEEKLIAAHEALDYVMSEIDDLLAGAEDEEAAQERLLFVSRPANEVLGLILVENLLFDRVVKQLLTNEINNR